MRFREGGWVIAAAGVIALALLAWATYAVRRASIRTFFVDGVPSSSRALVPDAGEAMTTVARTRVVLVDGLSRAHAKTLPGLDAICDAGLELGVDTGFPTVSLPVQHALWTGLTQQESGVGLGAERGQPAGHPARGRALRLEQGAQGEQQVGQLLAGQQALGGHVEAAQRPGHRALLRGAARHEAEEGTQLVLLLGLDQERGGRVVLGPAQGQRLPGRDADPGPGQRAEGKAPVVVEAQAGEQPPQCRPGAMDRAGVAGDRVEGGDHQRLRRTVQPRPACRVGGLGELVAADQGQAVAKGNLRRSDLEAVEDGNGGLLGALLVQGLLELEPGAVEEALVEDEVDRLGEDPRQEAVHRGLGAVAA